MRQQHTLCRVTLMLPWASKQDLNEREGCLNRSLQKHSFNGMIICTFQPNIKTSATLLAMSAGNFEPQGIQIGEGASDLSTTEINLAQSGCKYLFIPPPFPWASNQFPQFSPVVCLVSHLSPHPEDRARVYVMNRAEQF